MVKGHTCIRITAQCQCGGRDWGGGGGGGGHVQCKSIILLYIICYNKISLRTVSVTVSIAVPPVVVALQVYCPP